MCFSPTDPELAKHAGGALAQAVGCACDENLSTQNGYCVSGVALICEQGKWISVIDGPCSPPGLISLEMCEARGGEQLPPLSDRPLLDYKTEGVCPDGRELLGATIVEPLAEARCCKLR